MSIMRRESRTAWPTTEFAWPEERIDRVFRDMFRDVFAARTMADRYEAIMHPVQVEEYLEGDTCVIRAELPGIDPDKDVEVTIQDGVLHLMAERNERAEDKRPDGYRTEFRYGSFRRSIPLPDGASEKDIKATYADGILEVRLPVVQPVAATQPITVPVNRG
ncbi:MAG: Hsp20/alpha crystallin family protein [Jatrophihabitans sp.]|uniref:Hsp20/alpha crystallin family protein n=1 Tax=Jatrophihabitans sp. TaxID=1932789 RepID=UPI003F81FA8F